MKNAKEDVFRGEEKGGTKGSNQGSRSGAERKDDSFLGLSLSTGCC